MIIRQKDVSLDDFIVTNIIYILSKIPIWVLIFATVVYSNLSIFSLVTISISILLFRAYLSLTMFDTSIKQSVYKSFMSLSVTVFVTIATISTVLVYSFLLDSFSKILILSIFILIVIIYPKNDIDQADTRYTKYNRLIRFVVTISWLGILLTDSTEHKLLNLAVIILLEFTDLFYLNVIKVSLKETSENISS